MSKKITFDYWTALYSHRTEYMFSSEIRDLLALSARPDIISFAGGLPEVRALNFQKLEKYVKRTLKTDGDINVQYGRSDGYYPFKAKLIEVMKLEGIDAVEEDIITTTGGQQALDLLAKIFINPGDTVITESPAYTGALNSFKSYEAKIIDISVDDNGMDTSILENKLEESNDGVLNVKVIHKNGTPHYLNLYPQILMKNNTACAIQVVGTDVTEFKNKERELKLWKDCIDASITGIGLTDLEGKVLYVNEACATMWGYNKTEEIIG